MKPFLTLCLLLALLQSEAQKNWIDVRNINEAGLLPESALLYSLPMNKIHVRVGVTKRVVAAGPFHQYAAKYLGEENVNQSDKIAWEITRVEYYTTALPDTAQIYAIASSGSHVGAFVSLTSEGFLRAINDPDPLRVDAVSLQTAWKGNTTDHSRPSSFAQLSTKQSLVEQIDTVYKQVQQDSMVVRVPIVRRQLVQKTDEQKAAEIAKLLFTLRDDKNALLIGEGDGQALPDGAALKVMIEQMDALERNYMELFIGSSWQEDYQFDYEYLPHPMRPFERKVLFKFSAQHGVLPAEDPRGLPILLSIQKENTQEPMRLFLEKQRRMRKKPLEELGLAYRLPGQAKVSLQKNRETLFEELLQVAQFGLVHHLPAELMKRSDYSIRFNPLYGSLIGVSSSPANPTKP